MLCSASCYGPNGHFQGLNPLIIVESAITEFYNSAYSEVSLHKAQKKNFFRLLIDYHCFSPFFYEFLCLEKAPVVYFQLFSGWLLFFSQLFSEFNPFLWLSYSKLQEMYSFFINVL